MSDSAIPRTVARQAPLCLEFRRQESWSGLPQPGSKLKTTRRPLGPPWLPAPCPAVGARMRVDSATALWPGLPGVSSGPRGKHHSRGRLGLVFLAVGSVSSGQISRQAAGHAYPAVPTPQGLCAQKGGDLSPRPRLPERLLFSLEVGIFQTSVDCPEGWKHYVRRALKPPRGRRREVGNRQKTS